MYGRVWLRTVPVIAQVMDSIQPDQTVRLNKAARDSVRTTYPELQRTSYTVLLLSVEISAFHPSAYASTLYPAYGYPVTKRYRIMLPRTYDFKVLADLLGAVARETGNSTHIIPIIAVLLGSYHAFNQQYVYVLRAMRATCMHRSVVVVLPSTEYRTTL